MGCWQERFLSVAACYGDVCVKLGAGRWCAGYKAAQAGLGESSGVETCRTFTQSAMFVQSLGTLTTVVSGIGGGSKRLPVVMGVSFTFGTTLTYIIH